MTIQPATAAAVTTLVLPPMTRERIIAINARVAELLKPLAAEFQVEAHVHSAHFVEVAGTARMDVHFSPIDADGHTVTQEELNYRKLARKFNLNQNFLHASFTYNDKTYTVTGLDPRKRKFPVVTKTPEGTLTRFRACTVINAMKAKAAAPAAPEAPVTPAAEQPAAETPAATVA